MYAMHPLPSTARMLLRLLLDSAEHGGEHDGKNILTEKSYARTYLALQLSLRDGVSGCTKRGGDDKEPLTGYNPLLDPEPCQKPYAGTHTRPPIKPPWRRLRLHKAGRG